MNSDGLCMGIALQADAMEIVTLNRGRMVSQTLPASSQGVALLKAQLGKLRRPVRLAISGTLAGMTALSLALAISHVVTGEVFILSDLAPTTVTAPQELARYAGRAI